jgi:hypothetical protein
MLRDMHHGTPTNPGDAIQDMREASRAQGPPSGV